MRGADSPGARLSPERWRWLAVEVRQTLALAIPITVGFVGQMLMGIADTVMIGQVGTVPLAAAAFGHNLFNIPMVAGMGMMSAVGVLVSQAYGGQRREAAGEALRHGLILSVGCGLVTALGLWATRAHYGWLRQPPEVLEEAQVYLVLLGMSMVPTLLSHTLKLFCDSLTRVWPPMFILLGGVLLNVGLNWLWIFGHLGFPALGLAGAGWATFVSRIVTALAMATYVFWGPAFRPWLPRRWWVGTDRLVWQSLGRMGAPVAVQHLLEVGAFVAASLMMGWIGATALAAHQIAITCAATTYMCALGIGMAVSIRVGHAWGAQAPEQLRRVGTAGFLMTAVMMGAFGWLFFTRAHGLATLFTPEPEVVSVAAGMLMVAAFFQIFDGLQVVALCALRGMSDVRAPALLAAVAYWLIALPLGYGLCFSLDGGPNGMWTGLAAGLGTAAVVLMGRFHRLSRG